MVERFRLRMCSWGNPRQGKMLKDSITGDKAKLVLDGKTYELPIFKGSEGEMAIDIRSLRAETGYITLDSGYMNTGSCASNITFLDGEKGVLNYRGYPIEDLANNCSFVEVSYLLVHGSLPTKEQHRRFSTLLNYYALVHEDMVHFFDHFPTGAAPMSILGSMVNSLSTYYPLYS